MGLSSRQSAGWQRERRGDPCSGPWGGILCFPTPIPPPQGAANFYGRSNSLDDADNVIAIVGAPTSTNFGVYSTNDGQTFQVFPTSPGTGDSYGTDTVAVSANGSSIVWSQSGLAPYYTINDGTTWTASTGGMAANGQIIADRVTAGDFYYHVGTDIYFSSNGGV